MNVHGKRAAPTAKAIMRGWVRRTRRVRAEARGSAGFTAERCVRALSRFVVAIFPLPRKAQLCRRVNLGRRLAVSCLKLRSRNSPAPAQNHFTACAHTRGTRAAVSDCGLSLLDAHAMFARTMKLPSWPAET